MTDEEYQTGLNNYYENSGAKGSMDLAAFESNFGKGRITDLILSEKVERFLLENGKEVNK